jgi:hypothetical protein
MEVYNITNDNVISSIVGLGQTDYKYTLKNVYPLINKLDEQRKLLDSKFYKRLERDILSGCLMPPLTLAFVSSEIKISSVKELSDYVHENISHGFILDGIQRLNTLDRASQNSNFNPERPIFFNIIIAGNKDKLLYRMITLNNGQRGMTPRHQIEMLTRELFDFSKLSIEVQTEKEKSINPIKKSFSFGDIAKGYMAFLTRNVNNENSKIIEEKMDEILVGRILDNDISNNKVEFYDIIKFVDKHSDNSACMEWLQTVNNFIGFCVGYNNSFELLNEIDSTRLANEFYKFETAFKALNPSKINLGKFRRELSKEFIHNFYVYFDYAIDELEEAFSELTTTD